MPRVGLEPVELAVTDHAADKQADGIKLDLKRRGLCWNSTQRCRPGPGPGPGRTGSRLYQRGLSKQMMKLSRYSASGSTHRNGITATSWQILFVVASSSTEAQAGSRSHRR